MYRITILLIVVILGSGCADKTYLLTDHGKNKYFLLETIHKVKNNGLISAAPLLVINSVPLRNDAELKKHHLTFSKKDIKSIDIL